MIYTYGGFIGMALGAGTAGTLIFGLLVYWALRHQYKRSLSWSRIIALTICCILAIGVTRLLEATGIGNIQEIPEGYLNLIFTLIVPIVVCSFIFIFGYKVEKQKVFWISIGAFSSVVLAILLALARIAYHAQF